MQSTRSPARFTWRVFTVVDVDCFLTTAQIVGGLHLAGTELTERIPPTVDFLSNKMRPAPTYILPMHCSGFVAKVALEEAFGEGCVPAGVGNRVIVQESPESEKVMFAATYQ